MTILDYLRKKLKRRPASPPVEYIEEPRTSADTADTADADDASLSSLRELVHEIDLSPQQDLDNYARGLTATTASVERWISSGLLMPDEMKVAEKILRIMRKNQ